MKKFRSIITQAEKRKGGAQQLKKLLVPPMSSAKLAKISDDRYLSQMTRCVFNAGFHWRVITAKWSGFEEAFHKFDLATLLSQSPDEWEQYVQDERIVRNWQKIQTVYQNAEMVEAVVNEYGSFGKFFAQWPSTDQIGLMAYLKKEGARLGGQTCQYFIRFIGKDGFVTSGDVITALIANGVEINPKPTSQRDLKRIQEAFNHWHEETNLPFSHISKILSYTVGDNVPVEVLSGYQGSQSILQD